MEECLAIIPARAGSKRIPKKCIKSFCDQPIIKYSIDAALQSECFTEVIVSTDDQEFARISKEFGANVPFLRSEKNSDDYSMLADVIEEVLLEYKKIGKTFKYFCCILSTAPFISSKRILQGLQTLIQSGADSVVPIVQFSYPIQRSLKITDGKLKMFWPENYNVRSQDAEPAYHDVGQFYWMKVDSFLKQKVLFAKHSVPLIIPEMEVQDIDTFSDWEIAELKYKMIQK